MSTGAPEKKLNKKLKAFIKDKSPNVKRYKTLVAYTESEPDLEEEQQFFNESSELIFAVFFDKWIELEATQKKGKSHAQEVTGALSLLKKFLTHLEQQIKKKWKYDKIAGIILQSLAPGNKHSVRLLAFDLLLHFIQALQTPSNENIDDQITLFSSAINLKPFVSSIQSETNVVVKLKNIAIDVKEDQLICPNTANETTKEESIEMLNHLLDFMYKSSNFQFWFLIFKEFYLSVFYPKIFQEMGVLSRNDVTGFQLYCPYEIQQVLINWFAIWSEISIINKILWDETNGVLMMEISRQSCCLPISYSDTIKKSIEIYNKNWLTNSNRQDLFGNQIQFYWKLFIKNIYLVFNTRTTGEELGIQQTICKMTLNISMQYAMEFGNKMEGSTWELLQNTIINSAVDFVSRIDKSPQEQNMMLVANDLFSTLLFIWIKSEFTTKEMWGDLQKKLSTLTHWRSLLEKWKERIVQLTFILKDFIYQREIDLLAGPKKLVKVTTSVNRDAKLDAINWNEDRITEIWFIMLDILGNLNKIIEPLNHELALSAMKEIIEILIQAEQETLNYDESPPIPVHGVFLPVLLECCSLNTNRYLKGILLSFSTINLLFLHKRSYIPFDIDLLSHYYRTISIGLSSNKDVLIHEIINSSRNIFSMGLPGVSIIIPHYLREIDRLFNSALLHSVPSDVEKNAITIINSLIFFPVHYENLNIPIVQVNDQQQTGEMDSKELNDSISSILTSGLRRETSGVKQLCLWGISVLLSLHLHSNDPSIYIDFISTSIQEILICGLSIQLDVAQTSLDVLSMLASFYLKLFNLDNNIINTILLKLCDNIMQLLYKLKNTNTTGLETIIANHFYCLVEWLVSSGVQNCFYSNDIIIKVCNTIELGLFGDLNREKSFQIEQKNRKESSKKYYKEITDSIFLQLKNKPTHGSIEIRDSAEILLYFIMNNYNNFPTMAGPEQVVSEVNDEEGNRQLYFIYNDVIIISICEIPTDKQGNNTTIIVRDCTGKYSWSCHLHWNLIDNNNIVQYLKLSQITPNNVPYNSNANNSSNATTNNNVTRKFTELPLFNVDNQSGTNNNNNNEMNKIEELLHYLNENNSEIIPVTNKVSSLYKPYVPSNSYKEIIENTSKILEQQTNKEKEKVKETSCIDRPPLSVFPLPIENTIINNSENSNNNSFNYSRLLLSHLGFITLENSKKLTLVEDNARFRRSLKDLDKLSGRQVLKIGVVYVGESQEDQRIILRNEAGTEEYKEFIRGIGWSVDLKQHKGFLGGLDNTCGISAPYYADASYEVLFHTATRMPTVDSDPQQIAKKRHIGNDIVHIIWSDHSRDYHPNTITSQFNDAHIIIYPLQSGLYRIQINRKDKVNFFGPLCDEMVINKELLPLLVRVTAMNATMNVRYATKGYKRSFTARFDKISEIVQRYKLDLSFDDYLSHLLPTPLLSVASTSTSTSSPSLLNNSSNTQINNQDDEIRADDENTSNTDVPSTTTSNVTTTNTGSSTTINTISTPVKETEVNTTSSNNNTSTVTNGSTTTTTTTTNNRPAPPVPIRNVPAPSTTTTTTTTIPPSTTPTQTNSPINNRNVTTTTSGSPTSNNNSNSPLHSTGSTGNVTNINNNNTKNATNNNPVTTNNNKNTTTNSPTSTTNKDKDSNSSKEKESSNNSNSKGLFGFMKKKDSNSSNNNNNNTTNSGNSNSNSVLSPVKSSDNSNNSNSNNSNSNNTNSNSATTNEFSSTGSVRVKNNALLAQLNQELTLKQQSKTETPSNNTTIPNNNNNNNSSAVISNNNTTTTNTQQQPLVTRSYDDLKNKNNIEGLDVNRLEIYLTDIEFEQVFGQSKLEFAKTPLWKQNTKKRQLGLL